MKAYFMALINGAHGMYCKQYPKGPIFAPNSVHGTNYVYHTPIWVNQPMHKNRLLNVSPLLPRKRQPL